MILVDTSVWIDHERATERSEPLLELIATLQVLVHPFVIGELALGRLGKQREVFLASLWRMPLAPVLDDRQVLEMVDAHQIPGSGIGWVDAHLLGSALVAKAGLWTFEKRLAQVAGRLRVHWFT